MPSLLLDSGNLLFKREKIATGVNQEKLAATTLSDIYQDLGYDAVGVGPLDLAAGLDFIKKSQDKGLSWVSANIMDAQGKNLFPQRVTRQLGRTRVVITAISEAPSSPPVGLIVEPWQKVLPPLLTQIRKEDPQTFIILLSTLKSDQNRRIAESSPAISLLIGADMTKGNIRPQLRANCLITQTARQGKYQGVLEIRFGRKRQWGQDTRKRIATLQNRIGSLNWQLRRLNKRQKNNQNDTKYQDTITRLDTDKDLLDKEVNALKKIMRNEQSAGPLLDQFSPRFLALSKKMANDPATETTLEALDLAIKQLNRKIMTSPSSRPGGTRLPETSNMVGYRVCTTCHPRHAEFWQGTSHAAAYKTLLEKGKDLDLNCLPCHVTIDSNNSNFNSLPLESLLSFPTELQSVGCETCHGSGKKHSISPRRFKLLRIPGQKICLGCHTKDHDNSFTYSIKLPQVSCPSE